MTSGMRRRGWLELVLAVVSAIALLATLVSPDWIEELFGVEPDGGGGALEALIAISLTVATIAFALAARHEVGLARRATAGG